MILPQRKTLGHVPPSGLPGVPVFFVTICSDTRGENQFCQTAVAAKVFESAAFYHARHRWWLHLMLLMPDHIHSLVSFPESEALRAVVTSWKHYLSKEHGLHWQRDFFDHRLRKEESYEEKAAYIRQNPVRAGLVKSAGDWPFVWEPRRQ
jgi:putative transposase